MRRQYRKPNCDLDGTSPADTVQAVSEVIWEMSNNEKIVACRRASVTEFAQHGYVRIPEFMNAVNARAIAAYITKHRVAEADSDERDRHSSYAFYCDPVIEIVLHNSLEKIEKITGRKLFPTLSFVRVSIKGDELFKHIDRPAGEISATINLAEATAPWPIWMRHLDGDPQSFALMPGDAVLYQGCLVEHWREPLQREGVNIQCSLHYVDQNGPYAQHKWDGRFGLNIPSVSGKHP